MIMRRTSVLMIGAVVGATVAPRPLRAQDAGASPSTGTTARAVAIGNHARVDGLRINFRDRGLQRVRGVNLTIWQPYEPATGTVSGLALGVPMTGAGAIDGIAIGALGASATGRMRGIALGGVGVGSGGGMRGLAVGGVGVGSGGDVEGIALGGIGAGGGGNGRGLIIGGIGAGFGGKLRGIALGGIGVGAAGGLSGLSIGGIGVGTGGDLTGIAISGVGSGAGGNVTGLTISGIGAGAGGTMTGIGVAGVGLGAPKLVGGFLAPMVGSLDAHAFVLAPLMFRVERGGSFRGASVSAVNYVRGTQRGLTIGILNYARTLHGAQVGVVNIIADQASHRVLPLVNWGRMR